VDLYLGHEVGPKVDVWALGILLFALACFKTPFEDPGGNVEKMGILSGTVRFPTTRFPYSEGFKQVIMRCLDINPTSRPSVIQLLQECLEMHKNNQLSHFPSSDQSLSLISPDLISTPTSSSMGEGGNGVSMMMVGNSSNGRNQEENDADLDFANFGKEENEEDFNQMQSNQEFNHPPPPQISFGGGVGMVDESFFHLPGEFEEEDEDEKKNPSSQRRDHQFIDSSSFNNNQQQEEENMGYEDYNDDGMYQYENEKRNQDGSSSHQQSSTTSSFVNQFITQTVPSQLLSSMSSFMLKKKPSPYSPQSVAVWVAKATNGKAPGAPKMKYSRKIVISLWEGHLSPEILFQLLVNQPWDSNPITVLKSLSLLLKILHQISPTLLPQMNQFAKPYLNQIFTYYNQSTSHEGGAWLRISERFMAFLKQKMSFHEGHNVFSTFFTTLPSMVGPHLIPPNEPVDPVIPLSIISSSLDSLFALVDSIEHVCSLHSSPQSLVATCQGCLFSLLDESWLLYSLSTILLTKIFEENQEEDDKSSNIYKVFLGQYEEQRGRLKVFYSRCSHIPILSSQADSIPKLSPQSPLEEYITKDEENENNNKNNDAKVARKKRDVASLISLSPPQSPSSPQTANNNNNSSSFPIQPNKPPSPIQKIEEFAQDWSQFNTNNTNNNNNEEEEEENQEDINFNQPSPVQVPPNPQSINFGNNFGDFSEFDTNNFNFGDFSTLPRVEAPPLAPLNENESDEDTQEGVENQEEEVGGDNVGFANFDSNDDDDEFSSNNNYHGSKEEDDVFGDGDIFGTNNQIFSSSSRGSNSGPVSPNPNVVTPFDDLTSVNQYGSSLAHNNPFDMFPSNRPLPPPNSDKRETKSSLDPTSSSHIDAIYTPELQPWRESMDSNLKPVFETVVRDFRSWGLEIKFSDVEINEVILFFDKLLIS